MDKVKNYIDRVVIINDYEWEMFKEVVELMHFSKKQFILKAGQVCNNIYFINSGVLQFTMNLNDKEKTISIMSENELAVEVYSFYSRLPSISSIQALTDVELYAIPFLKLEALYNTSKNWERFGRLIAQFGILGIVMENVNINLKTPEQRYLELVKQKPYIVNQINLGVIASYLGITQETLSRIRSRI